MNINDLTGGFPERVPAGPQKINSPHVRFDADSAGKELEATAVDREKLARDPEVVRLVQQLNQSPEVRSDRIAEIKQRIDSGQYLTRQSAEETADALLR